jgi:hypothetical protein
MTEIDLIATMMILFIINVIIDLFYSHLLEPMQKDLDRLNK